MDQTEAIAQVVTKTDWLTILTVIGTGFGVVGFVYQYLRNVKEDIKSSINKYDDKFEMLENRIFQLAMGKSLKQIMLEEKIEMDRK